MVGLNDRMDDMLPGPVSQAVILDNSYHVNSEVWDGVERGPLECNCGNRGMRSWILSNAQKDILHSIGFGVFANPGGVLQNDARLVTALVERGGVKLTWLYDTYGRADLGPDPGRIVIKTQAYFFFAVGSVLFPTSSRNVVHPRPDKIEYLEEEEEEDVEVPGKGKKGKKVKDKEEGKGGKGKEKEEGERKGKGKGNEELKGKGKTGMGKEKEEGKGKGKRKTVKTFLPNFWCKS
ncbi:hypothetical protein ACET3Z_013366 [Daucus carota]